MERKNSYEMNEIDRKEKAEYFSQRDYLVEKDRRDYFVVDVDEFLDENEMVVEEKLQKLKFELLGKGKLPFLENFYDGKEIIENSELYKFLYSMPKGGLLHYHLTAAAPIDFLLSLTQEDIVYYNREKNKISINKDDEPPEGYIV